MAGAVVRARGALASAAIVAVEALALAGLAVAEALVGALHVEVSGLSLDGSSSGLGDGHGRVLLLSSVRVYGGSNNGGASGDGVIVVKISLGGVYVRQAERASALAAVGSLPVAVAGAHVCGGGWGVGGGGERGG